jgi:hypothetical protein
MDGALVHVVVSTVICFVLIAYRCGYRLLSKCNVHNSCHRTWRQDDLWMFVSVAPLVGRAVCVGLYNVNNGPGASEADLMLALKLLLPARLLYALTWVLQRCNVTWRRLT